MDFKTKPTLKNALHMQLLNKSAIAQVWLNSSAYTMHENQSCRIKNKLTAIFSASTVKLLTLSLALAN